MSNSDSNKDSLTNDLTTLYNNIFSKNTAILLIWFLALNFVCYHLLKFFFNNNIESLDYQSKLARLLDICIFIFLLLFLLASYYSMSEQDKEISIQNLGTSTINYINNADSIYKTIVFILFFYCIIYLFRTRRAFLKSKKMVNGIPVLLCYKKNNSTYIPDDAITGSDPNELHQFFTRCGNHLVDVLNNNPK